MSSHEFGIIFKDILRLSSAGHSCSCEVKVENNENCLINSTQYCALNPK